MMAQLLVARIAGHRGSGPGGSGSRTKAQVSTAPTAQSATRTQVEPAIAAAKTSPSSSRAWKTAPVAARAIVPAITRSIASTPEAIPTFSAGIAAIAAVDIGA